MMMVLVELTWCEWVYTDSLFKQEKNRFYSCLIKHRCATAFVKSSYYPTLGSLSFASPFTHWQQLLPHSRGQITILSHTDRGQRTIYNSHWNMQIKTHMCWMRFCFFFVFQREASQFWNSQPEKIEDSHPFQVDGIEAIQVSWMLFFNSITFVHIDSNCFHTSLKIMHDVSFHGPCSHASQADQPEGRYRL